MSYDLKKLTSLLPKTGYFTGQGMYYFDEIDSTNLWLLSQENTRGKFCLAENQTAGRGRRGKCWSSDPGSSLLLSMGWSRSHLNLEGLSLVSGLAVIKALRAQGVVDLKLKWPNDILVAGRKLGGILVEISAEKAVIGVGINIEFSPNSKAEKLIGQPWVDLHSLDCRIDRERLVVDILESHEDLIDSHNRIGFGHFVEPWNNVNAYQNQNVVILNGEIKQSGVMKGVNSSGALVLESATDIIEVVSGEVSLRLNNDVN